MVIVVIGILAASIIPRMDRDLRQELGDNILSAIRYTQHLALTDNRHKFDDPNWLKTLWHIRFSRYGGNIAFYTISSDRDQNTNVDKNEAAIDPANGKYFYHLAGNSSLDEADESPAIFIRKHYGISTVTITGGCANAQHVAFDHLGRPHTGIYGASNDYHTYMKTECRITFSFQDSSISNLTISIQPETGYAQIVGQEHS